MNRRLLAVSSLLTLLFVLGCKLKKEGSNGLTIAGTCDVYEIDNDSLECIEFYQGFPGSMEATCDTAQDRHFGALSTLKKDTQASACGGSGKVGSCALALLTVNFYQDGYTPSQAQDTCTSLTGTYTAAE